MATNGTSMASLGPHMDRFDPVFLEQYGDRCEPVWQVCVDFALPLRNRMEHRCTVTKFFLLLPQGAEIDLPLGFDGRHIVRLAPRHGSAGMWRQEQTHFVMKAFLASWAHTLWMNPRHDTSQDPVHEPLVNVDVKLDRLNLRVDYGGEVIEQGYLDCVVMVITAV